VKGEVFVLLYVFLFVCSVNDFSTTRGLIQAKFCMRVYSGSECVSSPFGGRKKGEMKFSLLWEQWGILHFGGF